MSIVSRVQEYMVTDDDDQSDRLLRDYQAASDVEKKAIDAALICLCGYSLKTIIEEAKHDDDMGGDDE
jgi:hypothetical protein